MCIQTVVPCTDEAFVCFFAGSHAENCEHQTNSIIVDFGLEPLPVPTSPATAAATDGVRSDAQPFSSVDESENAAVQSARPLKRAPQSKTRLLKGGHFSRIALLIAALPPPHVAMDLVLCEYSGSMASRVAASGTPVLAVDVRAPEYNPAEVVMVENPRAPTGPISMEARR